MFKRLRLPQFDPNDHRCYDVVESAAASGDIEAQAWINGEGHIWVGPRSAKLVFDDTGERSSIVNQKWRAEVLKRDGKKCVDCGSTKRLHAHHVKHWSTHPDLRHDVSNGQTLCADCHAKQHPELAALISHA